jgi:hypothetical protein
MSDVVSRRDQTSPAALADDLPVPRDTRTEILLLTPPQPHNLLRVSHVCRQWRRLVADPNFLRRFRARHNDTPPLLGVFHNDGYEGTRRFTPTGKNPAPARVFDCPAHWRVLDSRHGRVLFLAEEARDAPPVLILWDPVTRRCEQIGMPPDWMVYSYSKKLGGTVVCRAGGDSDGRHEDCRAGPFLVVLIIGREPRALVCVYSSEAGKWSETISFDGLPLWADVVPKPGVVIRSTLYQPVSGSHTLAFDLERKAAAFAMIPHPPETKLMDVQNVRLDGVRLGLVVADTVNFSLQLWAREDAGDWVIRWVVALDTLEPLSAAAQPGAGGLRAVRLIGACDYGNAIFLWTRLGSFIFHLDTMELKELAYDNTRMILGTLYPYESFFAPLALQVISTLFLIYFFFEALT